MRLRLLLIDRTIAAPAKLAYHVVIMMTDSGLKSAQRKRLYGANKLPCIDRGPFMISVSQELTFHNFGFNH
jgi:hypothetical protein